MVELNNLHDYIFEIVIPTEEDIVEKNGKRKVVERKKFPGYVYIKMIYTDQVGYMVKNVRGVSGFVGPEGKALPLTADEVKRIGLEKISAAELEEKGEGYTAESIVGKAGMYISALIWTFSRKHMRRWRERSQISWWKI